MDFPTKNLPPFVKQIATDIAETYGVPIEFPTMSIISAIGTALGSKARLTTDKYTNFPQLWTVIVAPSGVGKSEPLKIAYAPIRHREKQEYLRFQERMKEWKQQCLEAKQDGRPPPEKPKQQRILCSDTTPEALFGLLSDNQAITICRDELAGHFQDFGRYNKSGEVAHHLSSFDNSDFSVDRKGEENAMMIFKPILSMVGTIQPTVLQEVANQNFMKENGYLQRCLFVFPTNVERPKYAQKSLKPDYVEAYNTFVEICLNYPENTEFTLTPDASKLFINFANEISENVNATNDDYLKSLYAKMEIHALRLALILATINDSRGRPTCLPNTPTPVGRHVNNHGRKPVEVSPKSMQYAIDLCQYFIATGKKIHNPPEKVWTNTEIYCLIDQEIGIKNVSKFSESLGIKRQNVEKALKKSKQERILATDSNALMTAHIRNIQRKLNDLEHHQTTLQ